MGKLNGVENLIPLGRAIEPELKLMYLLRHFKIVWIYSIVLQYCFNSERYIG